MMQTVLVATYLPAPTTEKTLFLFVFLFMRMHEMPFENYVHQTLDIPK